jgi:hypothetical protein
MNDSKRVTQTHTPEEKAQYNALRNRWAELVHSDYKHELKAHHYLLYLALLNRDWRKAFSPVRRASKLANGRRPYDRVNRALYFLHNPYFDATLLFRLGEVVTPEMLQALRARLPKAEYGANALPDTPYLEVSDDAASVA